MALAIYSEDDLALDTGGDGIIAVVVARIPAGAVVVGLGTQGRHQPTA